MARLVLGPLLRHVGSHDATFWVETDSACEVEVLGRSTPTFEVEGHHYALLAVDDLDPGTTTRYDVRLDGELVWPEEGSPFPPSVVRTIGSDHGVRIAFGSCRVSAPHEPPYTLSPDQHPDGHGPDALHALTLAMLDVDPGEWPHAAILLGDQVYADEVSPRTLEFIRARRDTRRPPGEEVADFEEYTRLYHESWSDPSIRWFLSTVSTAMLFDDHDVHDDWNIARSWVERMRATDWWDERIVGAFTSYWIYQHLGNLSPRELEQDELFARVRAAEDAGPLLREFALRADRETAGARWSFCSDLGRTRVIGIDCRAGRVLERDRRAMVDDEEWEWIVDRATGDFDHLVLALSDPYLLPAGMHHVQAWNEAVCDGAWGGAAARVGERLRETLDLDHWGSFRESFDRLAGLLEEVGSGRRGRPPATIVLVSGDIHNAYLADVAFRRDAGVESRVVQAVCSPVRNPLTGMERHAQRLGSTRGLEVVGRALAVAARVPAPPIRWRLSAGPWFDNQIATLELDGRRASLRIDRAEGTDGRPRLLRTVDHALTP